MGHLSINRTWKYFPFGIYSQVTSFEAVMQINWSKLKTNPLNLFLIFGVDLIYLFLARGFCLLRRGNISVIGLLGSSSLTYSFMRIRRISVGKVLGDRRVAFQMQLSDCEHVFPKILSCSIKCLLCKYRNCQCPNQLHPIKKDPTVKLKLDYSAWQLGFCKEIHPSVCRSFCALLWTMRNNMDPMMVALLCQ